MGKHWRNKTRLHASRFILWNHVLNALKTHWKISYRWMPCAVDGPFFNSYLPPFCPWHVLNWLCVWLDLVPCDTHTRLLQWKDQCSFRCLSSIDKHIFASFSCCVMILVEFFWIIITSWGNLAEVMCSGRSHSLWII